MNGDIVLYYLKTCLSGFIICSVIFSTHFTITNNSSINNSEILFTEQLEEKTMNILIGDKSLSVTLDNSKTVDELLEMLPMEIYMSELNGNEKYYYLPKNLTTNTYKPEKINKGDIMLYGDNCLVIFYETFSNSYNYTYIGHIDDIVDLENILGSGNVKFY